MVIQQSGIVIHDGQQYVLPIEPNNDGKLGAFLPEDYEPPIGWQVDPRTGRPFLISDLNRATGVIEPQKTEIRQVALFLF